MKKKIVLGTSKPHITLFMTQFTEAAVLDEQILIQQKVALSILVIEEKKLIIISYMNGAFKKRNTKCRKEISDV